MLYVDCVHAVASIDYRAPVNAGALGRGLKLSATIFRPDSRNRRKISGWLAVVWKTAGRPENRASPKKTVNHRERDEPTMRLLSHGGYDRAKRDWLNSLGELGVVGCDSLVREIDGARLKTIRVLAKHDARRDVLGGVDQP